MNVLKYITKKFINQGDKNRKYHNFFKDKQDNAMPSNEHPFHIKVEMITARGHLN